MKKTDFDEFAENYDTILNNQLNFFDNENYFAEYKVQLLKKILTQAPKIILDYGCGTGRSCFYLQKYFPHAAIYGCDPSEKSLTIARETTPSANFQTIEQIYNSDLKADVIFIAGVIHHIQPDQRAETMQNITGLCKNGSTIAAFEHNPFNPVTRHLVNTCPFDEDAVLLKPSELKKLFAQTGINEIRTRYTLFFPAQLKRLRFLEKYLQYLPLGGQYVISGRVCI